MVVWFNKGIGWLVKYDFFGQINSVQHPYLNDRYRRQLSENEWFRTKVGGLLLIKLTTHLALRIQVCPKKGISPIILLWGWD